MSTCPTCKRQIDITANSSWRPFCSERCKLIDLGAWASERHAIPASGESPDEFEAEDGDSFDPSIR
ncbi:MAG: DNA gyrase inhibitor YacG [Candidatus Obscuribacterales bacterium]|nr:DNA gyrase inhibitor YacG [Steroidobacteraceae bacterium]